MKHNENADILLFLQSFAKNQHGKYIERKFFVSAGAQKVSEKGSRNTLS